MLSVLLVQAVDRLPPRVVEEVLCAASTFLPAKQVLLSSPMKWSRNLANTIYASNQSPLWTFVFPTALMQLVCVIRGQPL